MPPASTINLRPRVPRPRVRPSRSANNPPPPRLAEARGIAPTGRPPRATQQGRAGDLPPPFPAPRWRCFANRFLALADLSRWVSQCTVFHTSPTDGFAGWLEMQKMIIGRAHALTLVTHGALPIPITLILHDLFVLWLYYLALGFNTFYAHSFFIFSDSGSGPPRFVCPLRRRRRSGGRSRPSGSPRTSWPP